MADIEKVIKGINCHIKKDCRGNACPYADVYACEFVLLNDALELLNQMPIKLKPGDRIMIPENFSVAKAVENGTIDIQRQI